MRTEVIYLTTPLEDEHVATIRAVAPDRVEVIHDPATWPPTLYRGDHVGPSGFRLPPEAEARRRTHLARATILWDLPRRSAEDASGLAGAPNVRWVQTTSSGVGKGVFDRGLAESDLVVTTARGVHAEALGEFVLLSLLAWSKDLRRLERDQRAKRWERYCCGELAGKTLVVVGAGEIGAHAGRLAKAFGMRVVGVVARPAPGRAEALGLDEVVGMDALDAVLPLADALVLATPQTPATEGLITRARLAATKPGLVLVNIARGIVIDEAALIDALASGRVAFAGLDVAAVEPLPATSPLWDMENVLISPHSASTDPSENRKITAIFTHNLGCWLEDRLGDMRNVLDKRRMY
jgi:phosphoglycerate dehydrogenase-like enzyme